MKKIIAVILAVAIFMSMTACAGEKTDSSLQPETEDKVETDISEENTPVTNEPVYSEDMLALLNNLVETVQPGTAGSSLKAVYAARDLINWVKDNRPDISIIAGTIKQFFATTEYADEAVEAFQYIKNVFVTIFESDMAQSLLATVEMELSEFEIPDEIKQLVDKIFEEVEKYSKE